MILECQNCNKKFNVKDILIPAEGRVVQCGFCHSKWHQLPKIIKKPFEKKIIDKVDIPKEEVKIEFSNNKKKAKNLNKIERKSRPEQKNKIKNTGFLSYIFIFLISIIALFLIAETFKYQINNIFPKFGNYIIYVYETLNNILILIKDLFKSY